MKRILTLAAMVLIAVGSAVAQPEPAPPSGAGRPVDTVFLTIQGANELLSSDIIGHPVVNMADETLGEVETLAFTQDGQATAVVIGVGGFLGIGQRNVAIPFELVERRVAEDGVATWHVDISREVLETAPPYLRLDDAAPAEPVAVGDGPFVAAQAPDELLLEDLRGRPVVNLAGDTLGSVNAIVFGSDGQIVAAVVGVGGFLGIGQKDVAIAFTALEPVILENGEVAWRFDGNAETLAEAPEFTTQGEAEAAAIRPSAEAAVGAGADGGLPAEGFGDLAADVMPAVVSVRVRAPSENAAQMPGGNPLAPFFERFGIPETQPPAYRYGEGSGFFISADGFVVTNNHVVDGADQVVLLLVDGTTYPARVVGTDPRTDIALLKVDAERVFEFVTFADEPARIGDWILAVGNPFGLGGTVTLGIVSALGRDIGAGPYDDFMQIDAAINRGNSGGPAFNLDGEVIGVNTAIASPTGASVGIGFAIPAHIVTEVVADLQDDGVVQRGWLGVQIQPITADIAEALGLDGTNGALVVAPAPDGPAARAGVLSEDVVLAVNGEAIEDPRQLARLIASYDPGEQVQLTMWRDGAEGTINVTLGELPGENQQAAVTAPPNMQTPPAAVEGIGMAVAPAANLGEGRRGVVVAMVDTNGTAAQAGLQQGDVILEVEGVPVDTPDEFAGQLAAARDADRSVVLLRVTSGEVDGLIALRLN